jgi:hypothetical protein
MVRENAAIGTPNAREGQNLPAAWMRQRVERETISIQRVRLVTELVRSRMGAAMH